MAAPSANRTLATYSTPAVEMVTLTYDGNGRAGAPDPLMVAVGSNVTLLPLTAPDPDFLGWGDTPGGAHLYLPGATLALTANRTLYAIWKA